MQVAYMVLWLKPINGSSDYNWVVTSYPGLLHGYEAKLGCYVRFTTNHSTCESLICIIDKYTKEIQSTNVMYINKIKVLYGSYKSVWTKLWLVTTNHYTICTWQINIDRMSNVPKNTIEFLDCCCLCICTFSVAKFSPKYCSGPGC